MAFLDDDDDDLLAGTVLQDTKSLQSAHKSALKWLQDRDSKRQRKEHSAQAQRDKLQQLQAELAINEEQNALEEQQRKMEEMSTKVIEELDKGDTEAGGPEPEAHLQAIRPVQALPDLQLQSLPELQAALQQQRSLLNLPPQDPSSTPSSSSDPQQLFEAFAWLLAEGGALEACPSEAAARGTFGALCCGSSSLALAAYNRFVAWCGEPEMVAGCEMLDLSQLLHWSGGVSKRTPAAADLAHGTSLADSLPPSTIPWLPSAADVLQALADMGCSRQQQQGGASQQQQQGGSQKQQQQRRGSKQRSTPQQQHQQQEGSQPQQQSQQQQQGEVEGDGFAYRHGNLPLLLRLVVRVCRGHAAGRLDAGGLVGNAQQYLQLLLALLALMLDQRAALTCRYCLPEAFAALLELPPESAWDRLVRDTAPGSLLAALSGGLGPSHSSSSSSSSGGGGGGGGLGASPPSGPCHRSAVALLSQMPRSDRGRVLRQLGALQLMGKLIPGAKQQVPPARVSSMDPSRLRQTLHQEVRTLLGPQERLRVLLTGLSQPPEPGGSLQVWLLSSVLEAADMVLWEDVSTPGVGISPELRAWLLDWLKALDRVLDKRLSTHLVRSRVAAMENAYEFATSGCVV